MYGTVIEVTCLLTIINMMYSMYCKLSWKENESLIFSIHFLINVHHVPSWHIATWWDNMQACHLAMYINQISLTDHFIMQYSALNLFWNTTDLLGQSDFCCLFWAPCLLVCLQSSLDAVIFRKNDSKKAYSGLTFLNGQLLFSVYPISATQQSRLAGIDCCALAPGNTWIVWFATRMISVIGYRKYLPAKN